MRWGRLFAARSRLTRALTRLAREDGIAVPVAMAVIALGLGLAGVVLAQAQATSDAASEDRHSKRALQAANAGLDVAVARLNQSECAAFDAGFAWCEGEPEDLADGERYRYWVSRPQPGGRWIVSEGTAGGETRRVAARARNALFGDYAVRSDSTLTLRNNAKVFGSARSNANIELSNNTGICGFATPGPDGSVDLQQNSELCDGYGVAPAPDAFALPDIDAPPVGETDNGRICVQDQSCFVQDKRTVLWDGRDLALLTGANLSLGGNTYSLCHLTLSSNSTLMVDPVDPGTPVQIYIGDPEICPEGGGMLLQSNSDIWNEAEDANGNPVPVEIYVLSGDVTFESNTGNGGPAALYAPNSNVHLDSNAHFEGSLTGAHVSLEGNATVTYDELVEHIVGALEPRDYRECALVPEDPTTDEC